MIIDDVVFRFQRPQRSKRRPVRITTDFEAKGAALSVIRRKRTDGSFIVYAKHMPDDGQVTRGMVSLVATDREAMTRFDEIVDEAVQKGWRMVASGDAPIWIPHSTQKGSIRLSDDHAEMILEVSSAGQSSHVIHGRRLREGSYGGRHMGPSRERVVMASWHAVGSGHFEGMWRAPRDSRETTLQFAFSIPSADA